ncbi:unnamed protein product, partial [Chrysoparadoxa australica]
VPTQVDNISYNTQMGDLRRVFERYGEIGDLYMPRNYDGMSRGFCFVRYLNQRDADDAIAGEDGQDLDGRQIRVSLAQRKRPDVRTNFDLRFAACANAKHRPNLLLQNPREFYRARDEQRGRGGYDDRRGGGGYGG